MLYTILLILLVTTWYTVTARYAMILKNLSQCAADSKIVIRYSNSNVTNKWTGYYECLEKMDSDIEMMINARTKRMEDTQLTNRSFDVPRTNLCVFLNTDTVYLPYIRQAITIEKFCPIKKGKHPILRNVVYMKHKPLLIPMGCFEVTMKFEKNGRKFGCFEYTFELLEMTESSASKSNYCF